MISMNVWRGLAVTTALFVSSSVFAGERLVLDGSSMDGITAGALLGFAVGGSIAGAEQVGPGTASTTQSNLNVVKNSSSGFSANSRVRATATASGKGISAASIVGASAAGAVVVP